METLQYSQNSFINGVESKKFNGKHLTLYYIITIQT